MHDQVPDRQTQWELQVRDAADGPDNMAAPFAVQLEGAFGRSSADGLVLLAGEALEEVLPPEFVSWRGFARRLFQAVC
jgi:hypothetical protein